jgi:hypothetical protein
MSASWTADEPIRQRSRFLLVLAWWSAAAVGGAIGGFVQDPRLAAAASAFAVALLQAAVLGADFRYSAAWFGCSALGGAAGMFLAVIGGLAAIEVSGEGAEVIREGLIAWIALSAIGGLLLASAQAPLTGRRSLALWWLALGVVGGAVLWPLGLALGDHFGPRIGAGLVGLQLWPSSPQNDGLIAQACSLAAAWALHAVPFGLVVAGAERR